MLKTRMRRLAAQTDSAIERLAQIEMSVTGLADEDLLDLADIFQATSGSPLGAMARSKMTRRNIRL
jgi:hypothetical protein